MFSFFKSLHARVSRLDFWDVTLLGVTGVIIGFLLGRFWSEILDINPWWWLTFFLLAIARPAYHYWIEASIKA